MYTPEQEKIIKKLQVLIARKNNPNGFTENEFLSTCEMIDKLMFQYNLTMDQIVVKSSEKLCKELIINSGLKKSMPIELTLKSLADFCDCIVYKYKNSVIEYKFYGFEQDVMIAEYLYDVVKNYISTSTNNFKQSAVYINSYNKRSDYFDYQTGLAMAIRDVFITAKTQREYNLNTSNALVVNKSAVVQENFKNENVVLAKAKKSSTRCVDPDSFNAGYQDGQEFKITSAIS